MPPKKDTAAGGAAENNAITGFDLKDTKLLAAAFVASVAPDKYDFELMAALSGYTASTLKKFWPKSKSKAIDAHPSFAAYLGYSGDASKTAPAKANGGKKRKAAEIEAGTEDTEVDTDAKEADTAIVAKDITKKKPAVKPKGRPKPVKTDSEAANSEDKVALKGKGRGKAAAAKKTKVEETDKEASHDKDAPTSEVEDEF